MPTSKELDRHQSDLDFNNIVMPTLLQHGYNQEVIKDMLYRIEWGINHANWTVRLTDRIPNDVPDIEAHIRAMRSNKRTAPLLILQAYLPKRGSGPMLSYGTIVSSAMAVMMDNNIGCYDKMHPIEHVMFRCLTFEVAQKLLGNNCFIWHSH